MKRAKITGGKLLSVLLATVMTVTLFAGIPAGNMKEAEAANTLQNPRVDRAGATVWDCVYFGNYPQSDVTGNTKEPIKWRVLCVDGDDAFLVADAMLDIQSYNDTYMNNITWKDCTMRSWLNGYGSSSNSCKKDYTSNNFIDRAFTEAEQNAIKTTTIMDIDNSSVDVRRWVKTKDKLYLLSFDEMTNPEYGFSSNYEEHDNARVWRGTAYYDAVNRECYGDKWNWEYWYGRTNDHYGWIYMVDKEKGYIDDHTGIEKKGIVPALHLNLSFSDLWSYAGTVSSDGTSTKGEKEPDDRKNIMRGNFIIDSASQGIYKVTKSDWYEKEVEYIKPKSTMTNVVIPDKITIDGDVYRVSSIAPNAFENNTKVTRVTIGKYVTTIGNSAFSKCIQLKSVSMGARVTTIGNSAFSKCKKLKTVNMGAKVTTINTRAFYDCGELTKITIPAKVSNIGAEVFFRCNNLKNITIKTTKLTSKKIGTRAFKNIYYKATIKVPKSKLKSYKKILKSKGVSSKVKIK